MWSDQGGEDGSFDGNEGRSEDEWIFLGGGEVGEGEGEEEGEERGRGRRREGRRVRMRMRSAWRILLLMMGWIVRMGVGVCLLIERDGLGDGNGVR